MIVDKIQNEKNHALEILRRNEEPWGWHGAAGAIRKQRRIDFLTAGLPNPAIQDILEIGCGTGIFTCELQSVCANLSAVDISKDLIEIAKSRVDEKKVKFTVGDAHYLPLQDETMDLILGCSVLHHLDWEAAVSEFWRVLRPGGSIRFSEPNLMNPQIFLQKNWPWLKKKMGDSLDEYAFTSREIRSKLHKANFKNIVAEPFEFLHPATPASLIPLLKKFENLFEKTPLKTFAGSIKIKATK